MDDHTPTDATPATGVRTLSKDAIRNIAGIALREHLNDECNVRFRATKCLNAIDAQQSLSACRDACDDLKQAHDTSSHSHCSNGTSISRSDALPGSRGSKGDVR